MNPTLKNKAPSKKNLFMSFFKTICQKNDNLNFNKSSWAILVDVGTLNKDSSIVSGCGGDLFASPS
jgi:hypothetical protein